MTRRAKILIAFILVVVVLLLVFEPWRIFRPIPESFDSKPVGIMGTDCELTVLADGREQAEKALKAAETALRSVEARMSLFLTASEVSRLNAADAGRFVALSPMTVEVLLLSCHFDERTQGAFDVTHQPVLRLWRQGLKRGCEPTEPQLAAAREQTGWDKIELLADGAKKRIAGASVDLGGIAKGYGIDRAVKAMALAGAIGGLVNVGGDIRCFGQAGDGSCWTIDVRNPFNRETVFAKVSLAAGAVCTSGNYERYTEIASRRYSHIIDPRTGRPVDHVPSVTVVAPVAVTADAWATALSVLGADGLDLLPPGAGIEAMIVTGTPDEHKVHMTAGFRKLLIRGPNLPRTGTVDK